MHYIYIKKFACKFTLLFCSVALYVVQKCSWRFWSNLWRLRMYRGLPRLFHGFWKVSERTETYSDMLRFFFWHSEALSWVLSCSETFLNVQKRSLTLRLFRRCWKVPEASKTFVHTLEFFRNIIVGYKWLWKVPERSEVVYYILGCSEAFSLDLSGSAWIVKGHRHPLLFLGVLRCSNKVWLVRWGCWRILIFVWHYGVFWGIPQRYLGFWVVLKYSWRIWLLIWRSGGILMFVTYSETVRLDLSKFLKPDLKCSLVIWRSSHWFWVDLKGFWAFWCGYWAFWGFPRHSN